MSARHRLSAPDNTAADRLAGCTLADIGADHPTGHRLATGCSEVGCRMSVVETAVPKKHFKESVLASLRRLRCDFGVAWAIDAAVGSRCGFAGSAFLAAGAISCGCACGTTAGNSTAAVSPISIGMLTTGVSLIVLLPDPSRCGHWEDRRPLGSCPRPRSASACPAGRADGSVRRRA